MRELLETIKVTLQDSAVLSYIEDGNIFITPDENLMPTGQRFPAIGITDGPVNYLIEEGADWEPTYVVNIVILKSPTNDDSMMTGDTFSDDLGMFATARDIHKVMFDNKMSIVGLETAIPTGERACELMYDGAVHVIKKVLTYQYRKLEENPS